MSGNQKKISDSFIELLEVLRKLRAPGGCPWDRKQTSESLIPYLMEETYEIIEAIEKCEIQDFQFWRFGSCEPPKYMSTQVLIS